VSASPTTHPVSCTVMGGCFLHLDGWLPHPAACALHLAACGVHRTLFPAPLMMGAGPFIIRNCVTVQNWALLRVKDADVHGREVCRGGIPHGAT
jgi:hypothetical protein